MDEKPESELYPIELTPEKAQAFLNTTVPGCKIDSFEVERLTRQILNGMNFNSDLMQIDRSGKMIRGIETCQAVIRSNMPIQVFVVYGVDSKCDPREQMLRDGDFSGYLRCFDSHKRFQPFLEIIPLVTDEQYWKLLCDVWTDVEVIEPKKCGCD